MLTIYCTGTAHEIGLKHGQQAQAQIQGSLKFYAALFQRKCNLSWPEVQDVSRKFLPYLQQSWPHYVEEIRGVAEGSGNDFESILALNVRTEIAFGMETDGCTAFSVRMGDGASFQGQNWDWEAEQQNNLVTLYIQQEGKPKIAMVTEGGIIGKIGLNDFGVGVTLNAIYARGVDYGKVPCHLALRTVLECKSMGEARALLGEKGVASACHILVADGKDGGVGLECSAYEVVELEQQDGIVVHSNHLVREAKAVDRRLLVDSPFRLARMRELLDGQGTDINLEILCGLLKDEKNFPAAICRASSEKSSIQTVFSIVMDLRNKTAIVKVGRPTEGGEEFEMKP